jgi:cation diffusion facilitator CzcD-associated flavoprotein CzcO
LTDLGVGTIRAFETQDDVGGTWHGANRYFNLSIHTPIMHASFPKFPYSRNREVSDKRLHGADLADYMSKFVDHKKLRVSSS